MEVNAFSTHVLTKIQKLLLYNDMLCVVMNMLCFVSFLLMICWNLHMSGVEIYTFSVNVVLMVCWNLCIPYGKNWNLHIAWLFRWIWTQNVVCHCIIVIKHGLLCFVSLMHGWACIDYVLQQACGSASWAFVNVPTHALTFTKHIQPMFNYYYHTLHSYHYFIVIDLNILSYIF